MADVNHVITLGIGTPGDVPHFILVGLSPNAVAASEEMDPIAVDGVYAETIQVDGAAALTVDVDGVG